MGNLSFLKADDLTKTANIVEGKYYKFLIPAEFGGGFIKERYYGDGFLGYTRGHAPMYDMFELLAFWNADMNYFNTNEKVRDLLEYQGEFNPMKTRDRSTTKNRITGIMMGFIGEEIDKLKYPLKLVSVSYRGTYETCEGRSYIDPNKGLTALKRYELMINWRLDSYMNDDDGSPTQWSATIDCEKFSGLVWITLNQRGKFDVMIRKEDNWCNIPVVATCKSLRSAKRWCSINLI